MLRSQIFKRLATTAAAENKAKGKDISAVFPSLRGETVGPTNNQHFVDVQNRILNGQEENIKASWERLLPAIEKEVEHVRKHGNKVIPDIDFKDLKQDSKGNVSFPEEIKDEIKNRGLAIVRNVIPRDEARQFKYDLDDYVSKNPAKGFPEANPTVYELYWTKPQLKARLSTNSLKTHIALESLWHSTSKTPQIISTRHPVMYCDRVRMRQGPSENVFNLGPHIDGGGIERWEDKEYSTVYKQILQGNWENYDAFDYNHRLTATSNLHGCAGGCSMFRMFQGWISMSETGPGEGTLIVNPMLKLATAYLMLRPFFAPQSALGKYGNNNDYDPNDGNLNVPWEFTGPTSCFPNSMPGSGQELNKDTHPHLKLDDTMVSIPKVYPGDAIFWHCDSIHAVEGIHRGNGDSSVLYVPATPLCEQNVDYVRRQRDNFYKKWPAPDYPKSEVGPGENGFIDVGTEQDIDTIEGKRALGLEAFDVNTAATEAERLALKQANKMLGFP